ncbi:hypothetical protein HZA55_09725 [Candidatus Poribacteria bacterium]|nr:hypothetical protein [Candidatus Poribacteria bacterium]
METCLIISIDVEEDSPHWKPEYPYSLKNIFEIPLLQKLFDKYNIKPSYLLTYSVASDKICADIFRRIYKDGKCEIGTHLHPWTNPPIHDRERLTATLPCDLNDSDLIEKFHLMTEAIHKSFGIFPTSYRAGRYGLDKRTVLLLARHNYLVDTSVTPCISWKCKEGELSFKNAPLSPYYLDENNLVKKGRSSILEIPVSIINGEKKFLRKLEPLWLRPSYSSFEQMKKISDILIEQKEPVLNMMFHSNEIALGQSIFSKKAKSVKAYFEKLEKILYYLVKGKNIPSKTLSEIAHEYKK